MMSKKLKVFLTFGSCLSASALLLPILFFVSSPKFAQTEMRRAIYRRVVRQAVEHEKQSPEAQAKAIFDFVREHQYAYAGFEPKSGSHLQNMVRGIGWCNQQADMLTRLLREVHIQARVLFLFPKGSDISPHSVAEVRIGEKWVVMDPYSSAIFRDKTLGTLLSAEEIRKKLETQREEDVENMLEPPRRPPLSFYSGLPKIHAPNFEEPFQEKSKYLIWGFVRDRFGIPLDRLMVRLYVFRYLDTKSARDSYWAAKLFYLAGLPEDAEKNFAVAVLKADKTTLLSQAMLWRAANFMRMGEYQKSLRQLNSLSGKLVPVQILNFWRGKNLVALNNLVEARKFFENAEGTPRDRYLN
ncbi:MAG: transglutaminase-like domain-containing protein [Bdellovibrionota bacterium]